MKEALILINMKDYGGIPIKELKWFPIIKENKDSYFVDDGFRQFEIPKTRVKDVR